MKKVQGAASAADLVKTIVAGIQQVKGIDIVHLDLTKVLNSVSDHFVVCHGNSDRQVVAIANSVEKFTKERLGERPWHIEGMQNAEWALLDYVNVVVHVFHKEKRGFYALEELWGDAIRQTYENVA